MPFDGASVPRLFRGLYGKFSGNWAEAAAIHDALYGVKGAGIVDRSEADMIFREAMRTNKVPKARAWVLWSAVRIGGAGAWANGKKEGERWLRVDQLSAIPATPTNKNERANGKDGEKAKKKSGERKEKAGDSPI